MGPHKGIEFADFDVYKAWHILKYNVRKDPIPEVETLMGTYQIKKWDVSCSGDFHYPSRSQLASHHKASVSIGLLMGAILSLW